MRTTPIGAGQERRAAPPGRARRAARRAGLTTIACLLGIACATVDWRALSGHGAAARVPAIAAVAAVVDAPARALPVDGPTPIDLYRFALNALLVPLLDDSDPLRWTDAAIDLDCGPRTQVLVDGAPLVPGAPVPAADFAIRWLIDWCRPLGVASVELSGLVDLRVSREDAGLRALVTADRLVVSSAMGSTRLRSVFVATMSMAAPTTLLH